MSEATPDRTVAWQDAGQMETPPITIEELRTIDLFDGLSDEELARWQAVTLTYEAFPGEQIAEDNAPDQGVQLLLEGAARSLLVRDDRIDAAGRQVAPTWMGAIATMTASPTGARIVAESRCRLGAIGSEDFRALAAEQPLVQQRVMQVVAPVMKYVASIEASRDRLASLGTMAAGLAHELNNPAAAAQRAAAQMEESLRTLNQVLRKMVGAGVPLEQARALLELHDEAITRAAARQPLDALDAADAEDELLEALEEAGVPEAWRLAQPLAEAGVDRAWVVRLREVAGDNAKAVTVTAEWAAASVTAEGLASELQESTRRLTDLVGAVKSYAYLDRGELQELDVHEGIETTLKVLGHKLRHGDVTIVREYDRALPKLLARGPELTQVWTNLLDNAIDAVAGAGTITIASRLDAGCIRVAISDDGPGIPEDVMPRIFESFFTTKEVGKGTGLGLATAHRIVDEVHGGSLTADSTPGETTFTVWLPLPPAASEATESNEDSDG